MASTSALHPPCPHPVAAPRLTSVRAPSTRAELGADSMSHSDAAYWRRRVDDSTNGTFSTYGTLWKSTDQPCFSMLQATVFEMVCPAASMVTVMSGRVAAEEVVERVDSEAPEAIPRILVCMERMPSRREKVGSAVLPRTAGLDDIAG